MGSEAAEVEVLDEETEVEGGSTEGGLYKIFRHLSTQLQVCHMPASLLFTVLTASVLLVSPFNTYCS